MPTKIQLYGIKNCDTVRKSIKWLSEKQVDSEFHDLKVESLSPSLIKDWLQDVGKDKLINKRGLTWRKIPSEEKDLNETHQLVTLIQNYPTVVKRPVLFNGQFWSVGFNAESWDELFL